MRLLGIAYLALTVSIATALSLVATPAAAQSFFESLFGFGKPTVSASRPSTAVPTFSRSPVTQYRASTYTRFDTGPVRDFGEGEGERHDDGGWGQNGSGQLRTVCVRICDGYFWPLNDHATESSLRRDADRCTAACGTEARLFYSDSGDRDAAAMIDLSGRRYDALDTAFLYRTKLVSGCGCRPAPWSAAEQNRHRGYAIAQALAEQAKAARLAEASVVRSARPADPLAAVAPAAPRTPSTPADSGAATTREETAASADAADAAAALLAARQEPVPGAGIVRSPSASSKRRQPALAETARTRTQRSANRSRSEKLASSQSSAPFFFGKPKFVYPGDR